MELPNSWMEVKLNELAILTLGGDWGKDADFEDSNFTTVLCIRGSEFRYWNENKGSTASVRKIKISSLENRKLIDGDILVEISGGGPEQPVGRTVLIDKTVLSFSKEIPKVCTNFLRLLRTTENFDSNFLNLYLTFFYCSGKIRDYQGGSNNLRNLRFNDYLELYIPFPPLPEQHRIVAKIEALFSELDKGIESLKTAQKQLKIYRQALLKQAFSGKFVDNSDWKFVPLETISKVFGGYAFKSQNYKDIGKYQILRIGNIRNGIIRKWESPIFYEPTDIELNKSHLAIDDVVITLTGTRNKRDYGFTALVKENNFLLNQRLASIRFESKTLTNFFLYYSWTDDFRNQFFESETGNVGQGNVGMKGVTKVLVPLCSEEHQRIIVTEIEKNLSITDQLEQTITTALQQSEVLRQSILKKAFSGQLVEQDPNDEPASVLLERIKTEKAALINPIKKGKNHANAL